MERHTRARRRRIRGATVLAVMVLVPVTVALAVPAQAGTPDRKPAAAKVTTPRVAKHRIQSSRSLSATALQRAKAGKFHGSCGAHRALLATAI